MATTAALAAISALGFGQQPDDNPFPDVIARPAVDRPFVLDGSQVTLSGIITQAPVHIRPQNPYQYFRMSVTGGNTTEIWAVLIWGADSDFANLKPGVKVTLLGTPTKDGSRRVQLIQSKQKQQPVSAGDMRLTIDSK
jgi:hypothetical protein